MEEKIAKGLYSEGALSFAKSEASALRWAIDALELLKKSGRFDENAETD